METVKPIVRGPKPNAVIPLEAVQEPDGSVRQGAIEALEKLQERYTLLFYSPQFNTDRGVALGLQWILAERVPYDDLWTGSGFPVAEYWVNHPKGKKL